MEWEEKMSGAAGKDQEEAMLGAAVKEEEEMLGAVGKEEEENPDGERDRNSAGNQVVTCTLPTATSDVSSPWRWRASYSARILKKHTMLHTGSILLRAELKHVVLVDEDADETIIGARYLKEGESIHPGMVFQFVCHTVDVGERILQLTGPHVTYDTSRIHDWEAHLKVQKKQVTSELDRYLSEDLFPKKKDFDILGWWKMHAPKYPVLSCIARDVLAVQASNVASESAFSTGGRVVSDYRSRLTSDTVEALICLQDWLRAADPSPSKSTTPTYLDEEDCQVHVAMPTNQQVESNCTNLL